MIFNESLLKLIIDDIFIRRDFADSAYLNVLQIDKYINDIYFMLGMEMGVSYQDALIAFRHVDTWKQGVSKFALLNTFKFLNGDPTACTTHVVRRQQLRDVGATLGNKPVGVGGASGGEGGFRGGQQQGQQQQGVGGGGGKFNTSVEPYGPKRFNR